MTEHQVPSCILQLSSLTPMAPMREPGLTQVDPGIPARRQAPRLHVQPLDSPSGYDYPDEAQCPAESCLPAVGLGELGTPTGSRLPACGAGKLATPTRSYLRQNAQYCSSPTWQRLTGCAQEQGKPEEANGYDGGPSCPVAYGAAGAHYPCDMPQHHSESSLARAPKAASQRQEAYSANSGTSTLSPINRQGHYHHQQPQEQQQQQPSSPQPLQWQCHGLKTLRSQGSGGEDLYQQAQALGSPQKSRMSRMESQRRFRRQGDMAAFDSGQVVPVAWGSVEANEPAPNRSASDIPLSSKPVFGLLATQELQPLRTFSDPPMASSPLGSKGSNNHPASSRRPHGVGRHVNSGLQSSSPQSEALSCSRSSFASGTPHGHTRHNSDTEVRGQGGSSFVSAKRHVAAEGCTAPSSPAAALGPHRAGPKLLHHSRRSSDTEVRSSPRRSALGHSANAIPLENPSMLSPRGSYEQAAYEGSPSPQWLPANTAWEYPEDCRIESPQTRPSVLPHAALDFAALGKGSYAEASDNPWAGANECRSRSPSTAPVRLREYRSAAGGRASPYREEQVVPLCSPRHNGSRTISPSLWEEPVQDKAVASPIKRAAAGAKQSQKDVSAPAPDILIPGRRLKLKIQDIAGEDDVSLASPSTSLHEKILTRINALSRKAAKEVVKGSHLGSPRVVQRKGCKDQSEEDSAHGGKGSPEGKATHKGQRLASPPPRPAASPESGDELSKHSGGPPLGRPEALLWDPRAVPRKSALKKTSVVPPKEQGAEQHHRHERHVNFSSVVTVRKVVQHHEG